jgi:hypothetical protein
MGNDFFRVPSEAASALADVHSWSEFFGVDLLKDVQAPSS